MIIALLTDFGTKDSFVGAMKGVILSINENANIIDITHEIEPQDIQAASFNLFSAYKYFPFKTIFVAVVDPGVGSKRRAILVETERYFFVAPDNGLLSLVLNQEKDFRVYELTNESFFRHPVSQTFHGRDIFAPVAAWLSKDIKSSEFGKEIHDYVKDEAVNPKKISKTEIQGQIIHIDRFGNLITNLSKLDLPGNFILEVQGKVIERHYNCYAVAQESEVFSIWGSAGFLEIVAFKDSAKTLLKAETGLQINLKLI